MIKLTHSRGPVRTPPFQGERPGQPSEARKTVMIEAPARPQRLFSTTTLSPASSLLPLPPTAHPSPLPPCSASASPTALRVASVVKLATCAEGWESSEAAPSGQVEGRMQNSEEGWARLPPLGAGLSPPPVRRPVSARVAAS